MPPLRHHERRIAGYNLLEIPVNYDILQILRRANFERIFVHSFQYS